MDILEIADAINAARDQAVEAQQRLAAFAPALFGALNASHEAGDDDDVIIVRLAMNVYREAFEVLNLETIATRDAFDTPWKLQANKAEVLGDVSWIRKPRVTPTATTKVSALDQLKALVNGISDDSETETDEG